MITKRLFLIVGACAVIALACLAFMAIRPHHYYRYGEETMYLVDDPKSCWNGLWPPPVLDFEVPIFKRAASWKPSPQQVRQELAKLYPDLKEEEISKIIRACVSCEERESVMTKVGAR
jgi:hypothetical protein